MSLDIVIHGGEVSTSTETFHADIGIADGRIITVAESLSGGTLRIDASNKLVLPGGIEAHCHIAQESASGIMSADDYYSGSVSAAFGGNSCFIPFAAQQRGQSIEDVVAIYDSRAEGNAVIDYSFHLIVTDPSEDVLAQGLPWAFSRGITSLKVFMTYDLMNLGDSGFLEILSVAKEHGAITMVHAENNDMIKWMNRRLEQAGATSPFYHAISRPELAEEEAINRAIALSKLVGAPLFVVHVSTAGGAAIIRREQQAGTNVLAETCPQYLAFTRDDLNRSGSEGFKFICSPPLRDKNTQNELWHHIRQGTFRCVSSDHAPYRFDATGKLKNGENAPYWKVANGMPGIAMRLPFLFSEGVKTGRISLQQFVALSSTNAAKTFGLSRKGSIMPGMDADVAIWNPDEARTVKLTHQMDNMDYTPFEGFHVTGWPETVISRGEVIVHKGALHAKPGRGKFVPRVPLSAGRRRWHGVEELRYLEKASEVERS